jgi:hypothetical protein
VDIRAFVDGAGGIVHRQRVLDAGASAARLRAAIASGDVRRVRRYRRDRAGFAVATRRGRGERQAGVRLRRPPSGVVDATGRPDRPASAHHAAAARRRAM